jgi:hypothetical protein
MFIFLFLCTFDTFFSLNLNIVIVSNMDIKLRSHNYFKKYSCMGVIFLRESGAWIVVEGCLFQFYSGRGANMSEDRASVTT